VALAQARAAARGRKDFAEAEAAASAIQGLKRDTNGSRVAGAGVRAVEVMAILLVVVRRIDAAWMR